MSVACQGDVRQKVARYVDASDSKAATTAQDITFTISECKNLQQVEALCSSIASAILEVLLDEPERINALDKQEHVSDKLVHLCKAITELPAPLDHNGKPYSNWDGQVWKDLPLLGVEVRESWNLAPNNEARSEECYSEDAWTALNLFVAKLTAQDLCDFSLYAIWQVREALEGDTPWCPPGPATIAVPVAAHWVRIAGQALIRKEDDFGRAAQGGELWKGKSGFCVERWKFWKTRFEAVAVEHPERNGWSQMCLEAADRIAVLLSAILD